MSKLSFNFFNFILRQEAKWTEDCKEHYHHILSNADEVVVVNEGNYSAWKLQKRNEYMVDRADDVFAVWDGSEGGTANCVHYAESKGKEVIIIPPSLVLAHLREDAIVSTHNL